MDDQRYRFLKALISLLLVAEVEVETVFPKTLVAVEVSGICLLNAAIVSLVKFIYF